MFLIQIRCFVQFSLSRICSLEFILYGYLRDRTESCTVRYDEKPLSWQQRLYTIEFSPGFPEDVNPLVYTCTYVRACLFG
jgi:hypothetical protein